MKLLTYKTQDTEPRLGFIHNNQVIDMQDFGDISNFPLPNDMLELIDMGFEIIAEITEMIAETPENFFEEIAYEMDEVTILAPIENQEKHYWNWVELYRTRCRKCKNFGYNRKASNRNQLSSQNHQQRLQLRIPKSSRIQS